MLLDGGLDPNQQLGPRLCRGLDEPSCNDGIALQPIITPRNDQLNDCEIHTPGEVFSRGGSSREVPMVVYGVLQPWPLVVTCEKERGLRRLRTLVTIANDNWERQLYAAGSQRVDGCRWKPPTIHGFLIVVDASADIESQAKRLSEKLAMLDPGERRVGRKWRQPPVAIVASGSSQDDSWDAVSDALREAVICSLQREDHGDTACFESFRHIVRLMGMETGEPRIGIDVSDSLEWLLSHFGLSDKKLAFSASRPPRRAGVQ